MRTLYKRDDSGNIRVWHQEIDGNKYRTVAGIQGGAMVSSTWKETWGKNVGKANETTDEEQCLKEVNANYTDRLTRGYVENVEDVDDVKLLPFKPMLAKKYGDVPLPDWDDVWAQPKLDGMRAIVSEDSIRSRTDKPILSCPHIPNGKDNMGKSLSALFIEYPGLVLDGELYSHELKEDFNKIMSLARKSKPTPEEIEESAKTIQYWVYDVAVSGKPMPFSERYALLRKIQHMFPHFVKLVDTIGVPNQNFLDKLYAEWIEDGYEGQMVRFDRYDYENKRSKSLLKRKEFIDKEFKIVAIEEGEGNRSGMAGRVVYELEDGRTFGSGIQGNFDYFRQLLVDKDKYVGKVGTVKYFELTPDGIPRFPVTIALYDGERDS